MATSYQIESQAPDMEPNAAGTAFVNGWKITYKVTDGPAKGTVGQLFVSDADHNATYVGEAIAAKISDIADIATLGSN